MLAVSVQLSDPARVGTFVTPGTHIAIFDSYKIKAIGTRREAKIINDDDIHGTSVLLEDVLVIGMGQTALTPGNGVAGDRGRATTQAAAAAEAASFLVTVAVSPDGRARPDPRHQQPHALRRAARLRRQDATLREVNDLNIFDLKSVTQMTILWDADPGAADSTASRSAATSPRLDTPAALVSRASRRTRPREPGPHRARHRHAGGLRARRAGAGSTGPSSASSCFATGSTSRCWPRPCAAGVREVVTADDQTALPTPCAAAATLCPADGRARRRRGSRRARSSRSSPPRAASARPPSPPTWAPTSPRTGAKVLLVDLDLAFGDVAISLQLLPQNSIFDLVGMAGHLDEQGLAVGRDQAPRRAASTSSARPPSPATPTASPAPSIIELLGWPSAHYDFVIVDTPPAFTEHVLAAFDISDLLVLIATLDIPAVKNLRLTIDTLDLLGSPKDARVIVLNRVRRQGRPARRGRRGRDQAATSPSWCRTA